MSYNGINMNQYILTMQDDPNKFIVAVSLKDKEISKRLLKNLFVNLVLRKIFKPTRELILLVNYLRMSQN